jgi:glycosyltransferase involved in cell wall biosynthesis
MYRGHTAGVVIPAYNEEGFVGETIDSAPEFVDRIYVVDDGSTDGTWSEIERRAAAVNERTSQVETSDRQFDRRVVPIQHEQNRGVGGAIKTGYQRAKQDRIDITTVMGGDGQMEPEMLGNLFDPIVEGRAEYTKGNRLMRRTGHGDMPWFRFVGNAILTALTKVASGYWGSGDPQSGYTAISLHALESTDIEEMYEYYGYCNDLLVKLNVADARVADVPRPITYGDEESDISYRSYIPRVSAMLFRNFLRRIWTKYVLFDFHPLVVAYAAGAVATVAGALGVGRTVREVATDGDSAESGTTSLSLLLGGCAGLLAGMVLDARANEHLDATDHRLAGRESPDGAANRPTRQEASRNGEESRTTREMKPVEPTED